MNAVLKASRSTHSARAVLLFMCWQADFNRPEVTITKAQIAEGTGLNRRTVLRALRVLESEGTVQIVHNKLGGRGNAPRYRLRVSKGGHNVPTKGGHYVPKGGHYVPKGGHNTPPSIESIYSTHGEGAPAAETTDAARAERRRSAEKREGQGAGGGAPLKPERRQQVERFSLALRLAGEYGGAVRLIEAWDAGTIPEGRAE